MKSKLIFILWLLMFSFFSCDFGIKENEETNSKEYFTVKGSCSIQGAIPSDLLPKKSIKQNAQRTVVPKIETDEITVSFESETGETKSVEVVDKDGVLNFEVELPVGKWTVKAQGKKSDVVIIKSESCQIELSAENKSATNVTLVLKPIQSDTEEGTFEFSFGMVPHTVSGMKYTYEKHGATESKSGTINNFTAKENIDLSSGVYTFRFDFYSDNDKLLYSFTEVVNIFDGLTTDTWIGAGEYIKDGKICITDTMINQFISTTFYVSENGNDSNLGTFFAPIKSINKVLEKIDTINDGSSEYRIYIKGNINNTSENSSFINNSFINITPTNTLNLLICGFGNEKSIINAERNGRVMYIGENANVTLQNLILTGGYLTNEKGAGLYILNNDANVKIENSEISENVMDNGYGAGLYVGYHLVDESLNLTIENSKISNNTIKHDSSGALSQAGAGIDIENVAVKLTITNSDISENVIDQKNCSGDEVKDYGVGLCLGNKATTIISGTAITNNIIVNAASTNKNAGGGICIDGGTLEINGATKILGNLSGSGGGLYLCPIANDNGGNFLELSNCTISGNTATSSGGGILFCPTPNSDDDITTLNLTNCTISSNTATQMGGGIYSYGKNPKVNLDACNITNNSLGYETSVPNAYGGGICIENGTIIMNNTTISENKVVSSNGVEGAGVYLSGAELTMQENSKISGNSCVFGEHASSYGGGVYINNSSTFTMTSGVISENSAKYGGGVSVSGGNFIMNGGSISKNTADSNGKGVYVVKHTNSDGMEFSPTFNISGNACITEDNDVYLTADQKITITGNLSSETVATITPQNYAENSAKKVKVLDAVGDITLSEQRTKFNVTQNDKFITEITDEGCLKNTIDAANLNADLYDICSTIIVNSAAGMNAISELSQTKGEEDGKTFAGKTIILEDNIVLDDTYKLIKTFSGVFDGNNKTIRLTKPGEYNYDNYFGGAIFNKITGENAEVSDLNVSGEAYIAGIAIELENKAVISNCNNYATITSPDNERVPGCGGIVGELKNEGFIENCKNEGTITYNSTNDKGCGGIVGAISSYTSSETGSSSDIGNSIIANCINTGEIKRVNKEGDLQTASIGGICGEVEGNAAIYNCVNTGDVTSETDALVSEYIGGIAGYCSVSFYTSEFDSLPDDMGIFNCYNSGRISSTEDTTDRYVGGIVGKGYVYFSKNYNVYHTIRVTNTVNNDETTFSFGNITLDDSSTKYDIKTNYYKKVEVSPINTSYEQPFTNPIYYFVDELNTYSDNSGRDYLKWCQDSSGNIIFSEQNSGN